MPKLTKEQTIASAIRSLNGGGLTHAEALIKVQTSYDTLKMALRAAWDSIQALKPERASALFVDEAAVYLYLSRAGFQKRLADEELARVAPEGMERTVDAVSRYVRDLLNRWERDVSELISARKSEAKLASVERARAELAKSKTPDVAGFLADLSEKLDSYDGIHRSAMPWIIGGDGEVVDSGILPMMSNEEISAVLTEGGRIEERTLHDAMTEFPWRPESSQAHNAWGELYRSVVNDEIAALGDDISRSHQMFADARQGGLAGLDQSNGGTDRTRSRS